MRDLETLLNHENIEKAILVGASFGGSLAINFAVAHPDRVGALVVLGGGGPQNGFPLPPTLVEKLTPIVLAAREDLSRGVEMWLSTPDLGMPRDNPAVSSRIREMALENGDYWTMDPRSLDPLEPPAAERLAEIVAPTLILVGEHDQPYLHGTADQLATGIPGAVKRVLPGAGHLANMEEPKVFNRAVLDFLEPPRI
jgi:pimeloyl-ACP methyl ester carboxylesterase